MDNQMLLKEISNVLKLHGEHMDKKFDVMKSEMDRRFEQVDKKFDVTKSEMDKRFDHIDKKFDVFQEELIDLRETTNFLLSKIIQHEKKLLQLTK